MTRPTAILAEDEAPLRAELRVLLTQLWPDLNIVADCVDGGQAIEALRLHQPDVAFLDIRMPIADGLQVARSAERKTHIVFITAYDDFAVQAFEQGAVDYLLKPIDHARLKMTIDRIVARLAAGQPLDLSTVLAQFEARLRAQPERIKWITASVGSSVRMLAIDDVMYFQSDEKYTRVVTANDEAHIRMPIKELLPQLDPDTFWQIHRSTVVRVGAIRAVKRDEDGKLQVTLNGKAETLAVSPSFTARFRGL
jgi:DNA-binding LytR/AlgR family response regulator